MFGNHRNYMLSVIMIAYSITNLHGEVILIRVCFQDIPILIKEVTEISRVLHSSCGAELSPSRDLRSIFKAISCNTFNERKYK